MASRFRLAHHFETSALNYPKMTINTKRSKVSHICCRSTESQISLLFTLQKAVFELQAILRQVHWMAPKRFWTLKVKGTLDTCYNYPRIPNFTQLCSAASRFWVTGWVAILVNVNSWQVGQPYLSTMTQHQMLTGWSVIPVNVHDWQVGQSYWSVILINIHFWQIGQSYLSTSTQVGQPYLLTSSMADRFEGHTYHVNR